MTFAVWSIYAFIAAAMIYRARKSLMFVVLLFLILFWLQMFGYELASMIYFMHDRDPLIFFIVGMLVLVTIALFILWGRRPIDREDFLITAAMKVDTKYLTGLIIFWVFFKLWNYSE